MVSSRQRHHSRIDELQSTRESVLDRTFNAKHIAVPTWKSRWPEPHFHSCDRLLASQDAIVKLGSALRHFFVLKCLMVNASSSVDGCKPESNQTGNNWHLPSFSWRNRIFILLYIAKPKQNWNQPLKSPRGGFCIDFILSKNPQVNNDAGSMEHTRLSCSSVAAFGSKQWKIHEDGIYSTIKTADDCITLKSTLSNRIEYIQEHNNYDLGYRLL